MPPMADKPRQPGMTLADDLCDELSRYGVATERGPGGCRVTASYRGRCMVLCRVGGWWAHERPTTGHTVRERMTPCGIEWVTARHIADMLTSGYGVHL